MIGVLSQEFSSEKNVVVFEWSGFSLIKSLLVSISLHWRLVTLDRKSSLSLLKIMFINQIWIKSVASKHHVKSDMPIAWDFSIVSQKLRNEIEIQLNARVAF